MPLYHDRQLITNIHCASYHDAQRGRLFDAETCFMGRLPTTCTVLYLQIRLADSPETPLTSDESSGPCISFMSSTGLTPAQIFRQEDIQLTFPLGP